MAFLNGREVLFSAIVHVVVGGPGGGTYETYTGEYDVTPSMSKQTLETEDKFLTDNIEIDAIPCSEVTNNSGGTTITIG